VTPVGVHVPHDDMFTERELIHFEKALLAFNEDGRKKAAGDDEQDSGSSGVCFCSIYQAGSFLDPRAQVHRL
jgi:hypothetical protein